MYQILIVDDEPLILSGIKSLINWREGDYALLGTARNGKQALAIIEEMHPDIVICDINMPVMTGLELLKELSERNISSVCIMLTNYEEFDMARTSLRYQAVDYLLKSQLDEEMLSAALKRASEFCKSREAAMDVTMIRKESTAYRNQIIGNAVKHLCEYGIPSDKALGELKILKRNEAIQRYCCIQVLFDYSQVPDVDSYSEDDIFCIYDNLKETLMTMLSRVFETYAVFSPNDYQNMLLVYCWNVSGEKYQEQAALLFSKYCANCKTITPTKIAFLCSGCFESEGEMSNLIQEMKELRQSYYLYEEAYVVGTKPEESLRVISADNICNKLLIGLRTKHVEQCLGILEAARLEIEQTPHDKRNGVDYCVQIYTTVATVLSSMLQEERERKNPFRLAETVQRLHKCLSRTQILRWFDEFTNEVLRFMEESNVEKQALVEEIRNYVLDHMDKQIKLSDLARCVNMAPSYLSTMFKKKYGSTLFDFINEMKIKRACELLQTQNYKIYELSYLLGYENAYYFTKVFKRYTGMAPREYQKKKGMGNHGQETKYFNTDGR